MKAKARSRRFEMRSNYNFDYSTAVRGKYPGRVSNATVTLDPDVAETFHSSEAVNDALRSLLRVTAEMQRLIQSAPRRAARRRKKGSPARR